MRVLIDECIDERLRNHLPGQDCQTVRYAGLTGLKNGDLLTAAESAEFDAFLTLDQGVEYQQNLIDRKIAIVVFRAKSSRLKDLLPLIPACLTALESIQAGQLVRIEQRPVNDLWFASGLFVDRMRWGLVRLSPRQVRLKSCLDTRPSFPQPFRPLQEGTCPLVHLTGCESRGGFRGD